MKLHLVILAMLLLPAIAGLASGAPDTPPGLTWKISLPEPDGNVCNAHVGLQTELLRTVVANDGFIYTGEHCRVPAATTDSFIVRRISPDGVIMWTHRTVSGVAGGATALQSLSTDPANRVWVWYTDTTQTVCCTVLVVRDTAGDAVFSKSNADFTQPFTIRRTAFEEINATVYHAYAAGDSKRVGYQCTSLTECTELYELGGAPSGAPTHAAPYLDTLYNFDLVSGPNSVATIVNQATGIVEDTENVAKTIAAEPDSQRAWYNPSTDTLAVGYPGGTVGTVRPNYMEFNSTTLALVRDVQPTEAIINTYTATVPSDTIIDGDGNLFVCGEATSASASDGFLAKYNTTAQLGMRWNITWGEVSSTNLELGNACDLSPDGSIYVGARFCSSGTSQCQSTLRKYAGAATSRKLQGIYVIPDGSSPTATIAPGADGALGFRSFCEGIGFSSTPGKFLCGLIIVISGTFIMAAATRDLNRNATLALTAITGFGLIIFVTVVELWPFYTSIIMIILSSSVVLWAIKAQFLGRDA